MEKNKSLSAYQREFLSKIIAIPSVGGEPEEGCPYGREPKRVLQTFLDEAKEKGFRTGVVGNRVGWVEFGEWGQTNRYHMPSRRSSCRRWLELRSIYAYCKGR